MPKGSQVSRAYADSLPYASMLAWFDGSPKALIVLAEIQPENIWTWRSAERQSITTFGPFVISLLGLDLELRGTRFQGNWTSNPLDLVGRDLGRTLDIAFEGGRRQVPLTSRFSASKPAKVVMIEERRHLVREVHEVVSSDGKARHINRYWVEEPTGRCFKSEQTAIPTLPMLNTEILKYPSSK